MMEVGDKLTYMTVSASLLKLLRACYNKLEKSSVNDNLMSTACKQTCYNLFGVFTILKTEKERHELVPKKERHELRLLSSYPFFTRTYTHLNV